MPELQDHKVRMGCRELHIRSQPMAQGTAEFAPGAQLVLQANPAEMEHRVKTVKRDRLAMTDTQEIRVHQDLLGPQVPLVLQVALGQLAPQERMVALALKDSPVLLALLGPLDHLAQQDHQGSPLIPEPKAHLVLLAVLETTAHLAAPEMSEIQARQARRAKTVNIARVPHAASPRRTDFLRWNCLKISQQLAMLVGGM